MRQINRIVIHCSATPPSMNIGRDEIRRWHVDENGWDDIGYHYVIRRTGGIQTGRPEEVPGAHVAGHNADSLGVCLIGGINAEGEPESNYTAAQWRQLDRLVRLLLDMHPNAEVVGHHDLDGGKDCPCFNARAWAEHL